MSRFLLQMAGPPGAGKSSVARPLCAATGAVRLDIDLVKSSLLDAAVPWEAAGPAAYSVIFALAEDLLAAGRSVVVDSPSHYHQVVDRGVAIAERTAAVYAFVELRADDVGLLRERLLARQPMPSQMTDVDTWPAGGASRAQRTGAHSWRTFGPTSVPPLTLTVTRDSSVDELVGDCLRYLEERRRGLRSRAGAAPPAGP